MKSFFKKPRFLKKTLNKNFNKYKNFKNESLNSKGINLNSNSNVSSNFKSYSKFFYKKDLSKSLFVRDFLIDMRNSIKNTINNSKLIIFFTKNSKNFHLVESLVNEYSQGYILKVEEEIEKEKKHKELIRKQRLLKLAKSRNKKNPFKRSFSI
jgi:hypothetical protein